MACSLRIVAAEPNPSGDDVQFEKVHLRNTGTEDVTLAGWKIGDADGMKFWVLDDNDGTVVPGQSVIIVRRSTPMSLKNTGDSIVLISPAGQTVDTQAYGNAPSGKVFQFEN